jgi:thymidylate kinase
MKGKFITFYGINNIGKSTHAQKLTDRLKAEGFDAVFVKFPVYDLEPTGPYLNNFLRQGKQEIPEEELQMWFTLNRFQFQPQLKKWLEEGKIVVAEDYTGTGLAWGSLKGASLDWLVEINKHLLKEDLGILIEGQRAINAKEDGHIHETDDDLVEKCKTVLQDLAVKYDWQKVQLCEKKEDTAGKVWEVVEKFLN